MKAVVAPCGVSNDETTVLRMSAEDSRTDAPSAVIGRTWTCFPRILPKFSSYRLMQEGSEGIPRPFYFRVCVEDLADDLPLILELVEACGLGTTRFHRRLRFPPEFHNADLHGFFICRAYTLMLP